jgi:hypothetical protein
MARRLVNSRLGAHREKELGQLARLNVPDGQWLDTLIDRMSGPRNETLARPTTDAVLAIVVFVAA